MKTGAFRCLTLMVVAFSTLLCAGEPENDRATQTVQGIVTLQGASDHGGTHVSITPIPDAGTPFSWALLLGLLGLFGIYLLFVGTRGVVRFRRYSGSRPSSGATMFFGFGLGCLLLASAAWAALSTLSASDGSYGLAPASGDFAPGSYRIDFSHQGYISGSIVIRIDSTSGATVSAPSVELLPEGNRCSIFPADNPWNTDISGYPLHPDSDLFIASIGSGGRLHPDFGTVWQGSPIGIPFVEVPPDQPKLPVEFLYADESDPGPYPIPPNPPIEGGPDSDGDRHILMLDPTACTLYELFWAWPPGTGENPFTDRWYAGSGAVFDLRSNGLRPDGWTSADAAGLPIYPGLVRYDEVVGQGTISHALRFTVSRSQRGYIHPATHFASNSSDPGLPPMGLRLRMKVGYDCSIYSSEVRVICAALKTYGMFVADNGSDWYVSGAPDSRWNDDALGELKQIPGSAFEVVYTGEIMTGR